MKLYQPFHALYQEVAMTNNELLKICKGKKAQELLLRQRTAVSKALEDYHKIMTEKELEKNTENFC